MLSKNLNKYCNKKNNRKASTNLKKFEKKVESSKVKHWTIFILCLLLWLWQWKFTFKSLILLSFSSLMSCSTLMSPLKILAWRFPPEKSAQRKVCLLSKSVTFNYETKHLRIFFAFFTLLDSSSSRLLKP